MAERWSMICIVFCVVYRCTVSLFPWSFWLYTRPPPVSPQNPLMLTMLLFGRGGLDGCLARGVTVLLV